ncbi:geranylgeranyl pyrophosphate synthetase [Fusarium pseudoanthophilum]|uniref:Geranylgeranyl pyrophosphate synthetase n=1 Tax=Fusarium pseudoanthophilum TaxID=48495 RepID=A0A8H5PN93_9HYPO|nr:geranylgeranyl pyrophosphate synthetase [Fusarium pseudoanthophilum]
MSNNVESDNINNSLCLQSVSLDSIKPDPAKFYRHRLDRRCVVYCWTDDDKEEFQTRLLRKFPNPADSVLDHITVHKESHYQEPPYIPGGYRKVPFLQKHPASPFAVVLQAMKVSIPTWTCDNVDIIVQSDLLNLIFSWMRGDDTSSLTIDASLVKNTLLLTLFECEKSSPGNEEDEPSDTTFMPSPTSVGQHHIISYPLGGLRLLVTTPGHIIHSAHWEGQVCFTRILPTKDGEPDWDQVLPLLWFSGTHTGVTGSVSDGVFKEERQCETYQATTLKNPI